MSGRPSSPPPTTTILGVVALGNFLGGFNAFPLEQFVAQAF